MAKRKILVTAGNTQIPIDSVRSITNIFKGRTGTEIAVYLALHGHQVTLLTSSPQLVDEVLLPFLPRWLVRLLVFVHLLNVPRVVKYRTYDDLIVEMGGKIAFGGFDTIIHSAAVSDYYVDGVCVKCDGYLVELPKVGKVSSDYDEMYLKLRPTKKIIDLIRNPWGFKGTLVKFKLQVGMLDEELMTIANKSMNHSQADAIVANCLEWSRERAIIITPSASAVETKFNAETIGRNELPIQLLKTLKKIWRQKGEQS